MAPRHDIAHLGHVELLTPEPERSLWFFTELMGMTENGRAGDSVYLRTFDDYEQYSLRLTAHHTSGVRRTGLRASSQAALDRLVEAAERAGYGLGWRDGEDGVGRPTCAPTRTVTSSPCTGRPSGTARRPSCGRR